MVVATRSAGAWERYVWAAGIIFVVALVAAVRVNGEARSSFLHSTSQSTPTMSPDAIEPGEADGTDDTRLELRGTPIP